MCLLFVVVVVVFCEKKDVDDKKSQEFKPLSPRQSS